MEYFYDGGILFCQERNPDGTAVSFASFLLMDGSPDHARNAKKMNHHNHKMKFEIAHNNVLFHVEYNIHNNNQRVRSDRKSNKASTDPILNKLKAKFDNEKYGLNITPSINDIIGEYVPYRPPYKNTSVSLYRWSDQQDTRNIPDHLVQEYSLDSYDYTYKNWYGLKFDLTTKEVLLKVVIKSLPSDLIMPNSLPEYAIPAFFARIHKNDGTVDPLTDMYFYASPDNVQSFCTENNLTYPLASDTDPMNVIFWSIVFDATTGQVQLVKGYETIE
jgi:hypothetical protein